MSEENEAMATQEKEFKTMTVKREGKEIVLPSGLSYKSAHDWLTKIEAAEETVVDIWEILECYPLDGCCQLTDAMTDMFGFLENTIQVRIPIGVNESKAILWGPIKPASWNGGEAKVGSIAWDSIAYKATVKRKYEPQVKELFQEIRRRLKQNSIYKNRAVRVKFSAQPSDIIKEAPHFMDLDGITESNLILNEAVMFQLQSNIFTLIEKSKECQAARIPLRHGILLAGPYGTGKTLTAKVVAGKCIANGWTFIYLEHVSQLAHGLRMAELYSPAVLFAEDIDDMIGETRDTGTNSILNVLDGVDTKGKPIITMLTTNHLEKIHRSFLRAGRVDTIVEYDLPDADAAWKFVQVYGINSDGSSVLASKIDQKAVGAAFAGILPAFIAEAIQKSKRYCLLTGQKLVTEEILIKAAQAIKRHAGLLADTPTLTIDAQLVRSAQFLGKALNRVGEFRENNSDDGCNGEA